MNTKVGRTNSNFEITNRLRKLLVISLPPTEHHAHSFFKKTLQVNESTKEKKEVDEANKFFFNSDMRKNDE
ncbi:hypothetical protein Sjap_002663 [Stephania japonica]|uniref:Uncharacterized protein n=1 Tax=Stephania japonica TaxID=461633 RepID=A0AAP0PSR4_9MAGN